jgi:hypothetical protein
VTPTSLLWTATSHRMRVDPESEPPAAVDDAHQEDVEDPSASTTWRRTSHANDPGVPVPEDEVDRLWDEAIPATRRQSTSRATGPAAARSAGLGPAMAYARPVRALSGTRRDPLSHRTRSRSGTGSLRPGPAPSESARPGHVPLAVVRLTVSSAEPRSPDRWPS